MTRPNDILVLYAARAARGFGDQFAIIILPAYLSELGFGPFQIGIVASAALLGTAAATLAIGFLAPGRDLRNLLLVGAFATVATGIAFPATEQLAFILLIAFVGTMNPQAEISGYLSRSNTPCCHARRLTMIAPAFLPITA